MNNRHSNWPAYLTLTIGVVIIGFTAIFIKWAGAPGTITAFYRMAIASTAMALPFYFHLKKSGLKLSGKGILFAVAGGLCFGTDISLWSTGVMIGEATTPTLMANLTPIWVGLGAWIFFHEKQRVLFWIGILIALAGVVLVLGQNFMHSINLGIGALLGLIASVFYAAFLIFTQKSRQSLNTLAYFWIFTISGAVLLLLINIVLHQPLLGYSSQAIWNFLAIGLIGHVGGWLCINYSQGHLPASLVAPSVLGQPVVTACLSYLFFQDRFTILHLIGGLGVIGGILVVHRSHHTEEE
jgi:drug/metabolite transporter (DMT)-like permease